MASLTSAAPLASTPVRLHYEAPSDCPSAAAFFDEVKRVAPNLRGANEGESASTLDVTIEPDVTDGRVRGRLRVAGGGDRSVDAASCAEVSGLLAFAAAMAVEGGDAPSQSRPSEPAIRPSEPRSDATHSRAMPAADNALRQNLSISAAVAVVTLGDNSAIGAAVLYRRKYLVVGVVGDLGSVPSSDFWSVSGAAGLATNPLSWLRVDVLGTVGVDAYSRGSPPDHSGASDASALLPLVGARLRATVEVSNVAFGLAGSAETDLGSATRSYTPYPQQTGSGTDFAVQPTRTFSLGGARVMAGLVLGVTFDL